MAHFDEVIFIVVEGREVDLTFSFNEQAETVGTGDAHIAEVFVVAHCLRTDELFMFGSDSGFVEGGLRTGLAVGEV